MRKKIIPQSGKSIPVRTTSTIFPDGKILTILPSFSPVYMFPK